MAFKQTRLQDIIERDSKWFESHVAELTNTPESPLWMTRWKNPESSNYWMDIIVSYNVLFVRGDLGEAVYIFSGQVTPQSLLDCDFHYFYGKCEASEKGRRPTDWEKEAAVEWLNWKRKEWENEDEEFRAPKDTLDALLEEMEEAAGFREEWQDFIKEHYHSRDDEIEECFGQDVYIEGGMWEAGEVPMHRCILHWLGIRLALKSLGY